MSLIVGLVIPEVDSPDNDMFNVIHHALVTIVVWKFLRPLGQESN